MKNSTILMTIIAIVFSLSNTFAQTTIIKSGLITNAVGMEAEYNVNNSIISFISGVSYSQSNGRFDESMLFHDSYKYEVIRTSQNYKVHGAMRIYTGRIKNGMNFYFQPQFSVVKTYGHERQVRSSSILGILATVAYIASTGEIGAIGLNKKTTEYKEGKINQTKLLGSINTGFMLKKNRFTFDLGVGYQIGKINPQTFPIVGDLKFGYAF